MPWLDSVAAFLEAIAWPMALIVIALLFREPLVALLKDLHSLRYKTLGLEFGRKIQELESRADEANLPPASRDEDIPVPERLASLSPRAAVAEAWRDVELTLRDVARRRGLETSKNVSRLTQELAQHGVVSPSTLTLLNDMRTVRNQAVHTSELDLQPVDALQYVELAERVKNSVVRPSA